MKTPIALILAFYLITSTSHGQDDIFSSMDSTFNAYVNNMDDEFTGYVKEMDEEFYRYLGQEWTTFEVLEGTTRRAQYSNLESSNLIFTASRSYPNYPKSPNKYYNSINISFFENRLSIKYDPTSSKLKLKSLSETDISNGWKQLSESNFSETIADIISVKKRLNLNDWATYCLINELSSQLFATSNSEKALFSCFLLTHLGYDVKLGRTSRDTSLYQNELIMLMPFTSQAFNLNRIDIANKIYYIEPLEKNWREKKTIFSYRKNLSLAKNNLNLHVKSLPQLGSTIIRRKLNLQASTVPSHISCKKALVDFYNTYPNTELSVYLNAPLSQELKNSLTSSLQSFKVSQQNNTAKINKLLNWFYSSFSYKEDNIEKALFAEQSPLQKYTDCEDRAIFFARIAKEIFDLDVVLFVFDDHVATGVYLPSNPNDYSLMFKGKRYVICDPSSKECKAGFVMKEYANKKATILPVLY